MFKKVLLVAALSLAGCSTMNEKISPLAESLEKKFEAAVMEVDARYGNGIVIIDSKGFRAINRLTSTGVAISSKLVLTTRHGVTGNPTAIFLHPGDGHIYSSRIAWEHETLDIAVLEVMSAKQLPVWVTLEQRVPKAGDAVISMGYPRRNWTVSDGRVWDESALGIIDPKTAPGASGSPVFNAAGKVIGLKKAINLACLGSQVRLVRLDGPPPPVFIEECTELVSIAEFCKSYGRCAELQ